MGVKRRAQGRASGDALRRGLRPQPLQRPDASTQCRAADKVTAVQAIWREFHHLDVYFQLLTWRRGWRDDRHGVHGGHLDDWFGSGGQIGFCHILALDHARRQGALTSGAGIGGGCRPSTGGALPYGIICTP